MTKAKVKDKDAPIDIGSGLFRKDVRFFMTHTLWEKLQARALEEGKRAGRPRSVSSVMRTMLEQGVARVK